LTYLIPLERAASVIRALVTVITALQLAKPVGTGLITPGSAITGDTVSPAGTAVAGFFVLVGSGVFVGRGVFVGVLVGVFVGVFVKVGVAVGVAV
jgi:hypothetical protein